MKSLIIWSLIPEETAQFYIVDGDYSLADKQYGGCEISVEQSLMVDELNNKIEELDELNPADVVEYIRSGEIQHIVRTGWIL